MKRLDSVTIEYALKVAFKAINNMVKYEALSKSQDLARKMKLKKLSVYSDSQLVISQVNGWFKTKEEKMAKY